MWGRFQESLYDTIKFDLDTKRMFVCFKYTDNLYIVYNEYILNLQKCHHFSKAKQEGYDGLLSSCHLHLLMRLPVKMKNRIIQKEHFSKKEREILMLSLKQL